eukprot:11083849-Alexandrium_andersonii.AAC.1
MGLSALRRSAWPPLGAAMPAGPPRFGRPARPPSKGACSFAQDGRSAPRVCPAQSGSTAPGRGSPALKE